MAFLKDFEVGARVFVAESADEWLGIEVVGGQADEGVVFAKVLLTNGIPGYERGEVIRIDEGVLAHRQLTVNALIPRDERD